MHPYASGDAYIFSFRFGLFPTFRGCAFEAQYDQAFGPEAGLSPRNLVDPKQLEVRTPDVTIHVNPERSDLVETRMIEGTRYILIRANEGVEVNGVSIQIS